VSLWNKRTGRNQDDIIRYAMDHGGEVSIEELVAHAREIIVENDIIWGTGITNVVARLCELVEDNARTGEQIELSGTVPLDGWDGA
jgi:hypothetical protein